MGKDCPFIHSQKKNRSTTPKGKGNESEKEKLTVAIVNIANHRVTEMSRKLLQYKASMGTHWRAEGNEQVGQSTMPTKGLL